MKYISVNAVWVTSKAYIDTWTGSLWWVTIFFLAQLVIKWLLKTVCHSNLQTCTWWWWWSAIRVQQDFQSFICNSIATLWVQWVDSVKHCHLHYVNRPCQVQSEDGILKTAVKVWRWWNWCIHKFLDLVSHTILWLTYNFITSIMLLTVEG